MFQEKNRTFRKNIVCFGKILHVLEKKSHKKNKNRTFEEKSHTFQKKIAFLKKISQIQKKKKIV